jgi:hypothetical protein
MLISRVGVILHLSHAFLYLIITIFLSRAYMTPLMTSLIGTRLGQRLIIMTILVT